MPADILFFFFSLLLLLIITFISNEFYIQGTNSTNYPPPTLNDPNLKVDLVATFKSPTSIAFLDSDDILVLLKRDGKVMRILNGSIFSEPLLDVNVASENERGLLGIAVAKVHDLSTFVFLYFTESKKDGNDNCPDITFCEGGSQPLGNRLYRYELKDNKLVHPRLLLDLPATPGSDHLGGVLVLGPDNNLYLIVGDGDSCHNNNCYRMNSILRSQTSNHENGLAAEGRGGILRITQEGKEVDKGIILGEEYPLNLYYAYGIRNSFGIDFDPVTQKLWDTENGPGFGDEINLVEPGFNSGWNRVQGVWQVINYSSSAKERGEDFNTTKNLANFNGKGKYSNPEFVWNKTVSPTAIKFVNTDKFGKLYENDLLVGDYNNGNIYHFQLNQDRIALDLDGPLKDRIANSSDEIEGVIFGKGFGGISDIEVSPDGNLYVVSSSRGNVFKISPVEKQ